MVVRTINEEPCQICHQITNHYDRLAGRMCPKCLAEHVVAISGIPLVESNKYLLTDPLIDHKNDIDAHIKIKPLNGGEDVKKKDWVCYWQTDASPKPQTSIEHKAVTKKFAESWLKKQKQGEHATPKIGKLTIIAKTEENLPITEPEEDCGCTK